MDVSVAVVDPLSVVRQALSAALARAGFHPVEPNDLEGWISEDGRRAVVMSLVEAGAYKRLQAMRLSRGDLPVVALLEDPCIEGYRSALRAGASAVSERGGDSEQVVRTLQATLEGTCPLPLRVAHALAATGGPCEQELLSPTELEWIKTLAKGVTVHRIAQSVGYSERELFRMLHDLYERMGVENRSEAIAQAARWGLLDAG